MPPAIRVICFAMLLSAFPFRAAAEDFTNAIRAFLQQRVELEKRDAGIVVGIVDEHGSSIVGCGKLDYGTDQEVNGDTLFEIGSITKTFTGLLLQDMIERGEMNLDDPVAKYLPESVKMPTRNGKAITLFQLVIHTSGLPDNPSNLDPKSPDQPWADYTADQLYAFLSGYKLMNDPGTRYKYSNIGASLLGHVIALKAGTNYESLVVDRICLPLKMNDTRITLTLELKTRFATGHYQFGDAVQGGKCSPILLAQGALCSTANDLLKYMSSNLGLTTSSLTPLLEKAHEVHAQTGIPTQNIGSWFVDSNPQGRKFVLHGGDTAVTARSPVLTKIDVTALLFCVLPPKEMTLAASVSFYSKGNGSRTSGQRRQKSAAAFVIRMWGNTSARRILLPRPALVFAAKETVSSPWPQDQDHGRCVLYCLLSRANCCRNQKPVFLEG